jgi:hypothetical protein
MQFVPGLDQIWVNRINPEDQIHLFNTVEEAEVKLTELQSQDATERQYKIEVVEE